MNRKVDAPAIEMTMMRTAFLRTMVTSPAAGKAVTLRGIAGLVGCKSTSTVHRQPAVLAATGYPTAICLNGSTSRSRYLISDIGRATISALN